MRPPLRTEEGVALARTATAMLDISDGIAAGRGAHRGALGLPRRRSSSSASRSPTGATIDDLGFGEDYELLAAVPEPGRAPVDRPLRGRRGRRAAAARAAVSLFQVGITTVPLRNSRCAAAVATATLEPLAGYFVRRICWAGSCSCSDHLRDVHHLLRDPDRPLRGQSRRTELLDARHPRARCTSTARSTSEYGQFVWRVAHGSLGQLVHDPRGRRRRSSSDAAPVTAALVFGGAVIWLLIAIPIGILSALRPRSLLDRAAMVFVLIGISAHPVWIGLVLSYFLGFRLHLTPVARLLRLLQPAAGRRLRRAARSGRRTWCCPGSRSRCSSPRSTCG